MSIFKRKPKIIKGHTFSEYLSHYGKGYINCNNEVASDKKQLKPNCRYYEINGKYYQIDRSRWLKNILIGIGTASLVTTIYLPIHFLVITPKEKYHDYNFKYWNECESLNKLKEFVKATVTPGNEYYVPQEDRIATFDMDGTLFGERSPIYIEWLMYQDYFDNHFHGYRGHEITYTDQDTHKTRTVSLQKTYEEINAFINGTEDPNLEMDEAHCGAYIFAKTTITDYINYVESYLQRSALNFNNLLYKDMFYKPMIEVVEFLQQNNFDVYVVSGTDRFMVRTIISQHLNISSKKVIGMDVSLYVDGDGNMCRGAELKYKNVKKVKPELIAQEIGNWPIVSFGNSSGDIDMHNIALNNPNYHSLAFMNVADDLVRERGYDGETLQKRIKGWADRFELISMKNDWKTIYGDNVTKK